MSIEERTDLALALYRKRCCPQCGRQMTLWELLAMLFGNGSRYVVEAIYPGGDTHWIPVEDVNPQIMDVKEPKSFAWYTTCPRSSEL